MIAFDNINCRVEGFGSELVWQPQTANILQYERTFRGSGCYFVPYFFCLSSKFTHSCWSIFNMKEKPPDLRRVPTRVGAWGGGGERRGLELSQLGIYLPYWEGAPCQQRPLLFLSTFSTTSTTSTSHHQRSRRIPCAGLRPSISGGLRVQIAPTHHTKRLAHHLTRHGLSPSPHPERSLSPWPADLVCSFASSLIQRTGNPGTFGLETAYSFAAHVAKGSESRR